MDKRTILIITALSLAVCCLFVFAVGDVHAQTKEGDKNLASKRGLDTLEGGPKEDDGEGPTKVQMAVGVGSLFVMIAVVKWL